MTIKIITLKTFIWPILIFLLVFSFPIQVILFSQIPSLFPYIGILLIFLITIIPYGLKINPISWNIKKIHLFILIYVFLVLFHSSWQLLFNLISLYDFVTSIVIFILPIIFYIYFYQYSIDKEIRIVLIAMAISGLISGVYFVYDSWSMLVIGKVSDFSYKMIEYSMMRIGNKPVNMARITVDYRSHGLLAAHNISAAWIALGCFALLALVPSKKIKIRLAVITIFGAMIILALNFTSIIAFLFVIIFIEFKGYLFFTAKIQKKRLKTLAIFLILTTIIGFIFTQNAKEMTFQINKLIDLQLALGLGKTNLYGDYTYWGGFFSQLFSYPRNMLVFPMGILIGDGYSTWGVLGKGGDFGHVETLHRFGLPFYIAIIFGLLKLIKLSLNTINMLNWELNKEAGYLWFAVCVVTYLLIAEFHYTVWAGKSIIPILFFCIAIFSRYLSPYYYRVLRKK